MAAVQREFDICASLLGLYEDLPHVKKLGYNVGELGERERGAAPVPKGGERRRIAPVPGRRFCGRRGPGRACRARRRTAELKKMRGPAPPTMRAPRARRRHAVDRAPLLQAVKVRGALVGHNEHRGAQACRRPAVNCGRALRPAAVPGQDVPDRGHRGGDRGRGLPQKSPATCARFPCQKRPTARPIDVALLVCGRPRTAAPPPRRSAVNVRGHARRLGNRLRQWGKVRGLCDDGRGAAGVDRAPDGAEQGAARRRADAGWTWPRGGRPVAGGERRGPRPCQRP